MNTIQWLQHLIRFDTTSRHSNLALIETLADNLQAQGLTPWLSYNAERSKANLFVSLPAADGSIEGGMVLSGHTDVVPVDGQNWTSDPFRADIRDGKLYGRGSCDMKGFIAAAMALVPEALAVPRKKPLHLAFSYDEEVGCLGAPVMLAQLKERGLAPDYCIVGEPTSMRMVVAHKGIHVFRCRFHGHSVHSSLTPLGVNAIEYAARLIVFVNDLAHSLMTREQDAGFDVPFSTLSVNTIRGGTAGNIVPDACELQFDFRNLPTMSVEEILAPIQHYIDEVLVPKMQAVAPHSGIAIEMTESVPALVAQDHAEFQALRQALAAPEPPGKVAYATEGGQFQNAGIPTVICGPGDIRQAHRPDEYVSLEQLQRCDRFLRHLLTRL